MVYVATVSKSANAVAARQLRNDNHHESHILKCKLVAVTSCVAVANALARYSQPLRANLQGSTCKLNTGDPLQTPC